MTWAEEGINDKGDLYLTIGGWAVTIESKNSAALNAHGIVQKANRKAPGDAVLWWKRTERKEGSKRRTQVGKPIVCMTEDFFMSLLEYVQLSVQYDQSIDDYNQQVTEESKRIDRR